MSSGRCDLDPVLVLGTGAAIPATRSIPAGLCPHSSPSLRPPVRPGSRQRPATALSSGAQQSARKVGKPNGRTPRKLHKIKLVRPRDIQLLLNFEKESASNQTSEKVGVPHKMSWVSGKKLLQFTICVYVCVRE